MSANPFDLYAGNGIMTRPGNAHRSLAYDRRKRVRMSVRWSVLFFRDQVSEAVESVTENLSSSGFYCLSRTPLAPGESAICALSAPAHDPLCKEHTLRLECRVRVVRTESAATEGLYGIACQIDDYHLSTVQQHIAESAGNRALEAHSEETRED